MAKRTFTERLRTIDWSLLILLVGVTYVKLYVKVAAICFYFAYALVKRYEFKRPVSLNAFYFFIIIAGTVSSFVNGSFSNSSYLFGYGLGVFTWLVAGATSYFIYTAIVNKAPANIEATIKAFFAVNIFVSLAELVGLMILSRHIMPYWYWEPTEYFGASTGDHIHGIFSSNSVTNAMVNVLGIVYFTYNKQMKWAFMCLLICLMCTSNLSLMALLGTLGLMFVFLNRPGVRKHIIFVFLLVLVMYPVLSPLNIQYIGSTYNKGSDETYTLAVRGLDTSAKKKPIEKYYDLDNELKKYQREVLKYNYYGRKRNNEKLNSYIDDLKYMSHFGSAAAPPGSNVALKQAVVKTTMEKWYGGKYEQMVLHSYYRPIKAYSFIQTANFLRENVRHLFFGAGMGNFSSKLAIKMTGLNLQGTYPKERIYTSNDFIEYHFYTLLYVFSLPVSEHSTINMPNSVYNQVAGEYGLIGTFVFVICYLGYFWKNRKMLGYGRYILFVTLGFLAFEYWFEMLSLTIVFELLILQDVYNKNKNVAG